MDPTSYNAFRWGPRIFGLPYKQAKARAGIGLGIGLGLGARLGYKARLGLGQRIRLDDGRRVHFGGDRAITEATSPVPHG